MDDADRATEQEEMARQAALIVRHRVGPVWTGFCLWCGEPTAKPRRWCDAECREEWERRETK